MAPIARRSFSGLQTFHKQDYFLAQFSRELHSILVYGKVPRRLSLSKQRPRKRIITFEQFMLRRLLTSNRHPTDRLRHVDKDMITAEDWFPA